MNTDEEPDMNKVTWQIRYLRESQYRSESDSILVQTTSEADIRRFWDKAGYAKVNSENIEEVYGLFKVTYERIDNM